LRLGSPRSESVRVGKRLPVGVDTTGPRSHLDDERREIVTGEMNPLSTLALIVLLRTHADILHPTAPRE
jgi:hypothetical protein